MGNNENEDYGELINSVVADISQEQSGEDEDNKDYELLEILEAIKKNADEHLKKIKLDNIYNQFNLIKEITNEVLIASISKKYSSISQDQKEIEENIVIIKQHTLDELLNLSFKNDYKALATMLALVIEQFKEERKEKPVKLLVATQKAILILMVANEIKSIVREWEDIIEDKENSLIDDYLIDFMEDINRIGYLEGLLDSESRLANYHHRLIAGVHVANSRYKVLRAFNEKIRPVIEKIVKEKYAKGYKHFHNDLAKNMRTEILQYLNSKKVESGNKTDKPLNKVNASKYKEVIDCIDYCSESSKLGLEPLNI